MKNEAPQCPFVYANGKRCHGHVVGVQGYGPRVDGELAQVRRVRFWCSEKDDHAGMGGGTDAKMRMEFYPDQIPEDLQAWTSERLQRGEDISKPGVVGFISEDEDHNPTGAYRDMKPALPGETP